MYARNKISRSVIDARVRLIVDYFTTIQADTSYDDPLGQGGNLGGGPSIISATSLKPGKDSSSSGGGSLAHSRPSSAHRNARRHDGMSSGAPSRPRTQESGRPPSLARTRPPQGAGNTQVLADYSCINTHLYLFGKLIGVQPRVCEVAKPAVAYIAVMLMVLGLCDK